MILDKITNENYINLIEVGLVNKNSLMIASENGNLALVKLLLENGATPNVEVKNFLNQKTFSPLMYASKNGNKEIVDLLVDAGASINYEDHFKNNPLNVAAFYSNKEARRQTW